jgi:8-oxo-dGTP diphosphatase
MITNGGPVASMGASAVLFTDGAGQVLLVEPTYKDGWEFPGGCVEPGESPWEAAVREVKEEVGLDLGAVAPVLLCVDWLRPSAQRSGGFRLMFDGGVLTSEDLAGVRLPPAELASFALVAPGKADGFLPPGRLRRLRACLRARQSGTVAYLQEGHPVGGGYGAGAVLDLAAASAVVG